MCPVDKCLQSTSSVYVSRITYLHVPIDVLSLRQINTHSLEGVLLANFSRIVFTKSYPSVSFLRGYPVGCMLHDCWFAWPLESLCMLLILKGLSSYLRSMPLKCSSRIMLELFCFSSFYCHSPPLRIFLSFSLVSVVCYYTKENSFIVILIFCHSVYLLICLPSLHS